MPTTKTLLNKLGRNLDESEAVLKALVDQSAAQAVRMGAIEARLAALEADPVEPTDPTEPTEPTDPTDPVEPTEPTDPIEPTPGDVTEVASAAELRAELESASPGDEIVLAPGDYGSFTFTQKFADMVKVRSREKFLAAFDHIAFSSARGIRIEGVAVEAATQGDWIVEVKKGDWSSHIQIVGCYVRGKSGTYDGTGIHVQDADHVLLQDNIVENVGDGIVCFTVQDLTVRGNRPNLIGNDSFKFSTITRGLIENNWGASNYPPARDHQDFIQFQGANGSKDVVIRGNVSLPAAGVDATQQGIFFSEDNENFLIEDNIVMAGLPRGISVSGKNLVIRNNTVLHAPPPAGVYDYCEIATSNAQMDNNIWAHTWKAGPSGTNFAVDCDNAGATHAAKKLFTDFRGAGTPLAGLIPVKGSAIDGKGAQARLVELLGDVAA